MSVLFPDNPGTSLGLPDLNVSSIESGIEGPSRLSVAGSPLIIEDSPSWVDDLFQNASFVDSPTHTVIRGFCHDALIHRIPYLDVRYWDMAILLPNVLFLLFIICKSCSLTRKLRLSNSPVLRVFCLLVFFSTILNVFRSSASLALSLTQPLDHIYYLVLWTSLKFLYLWTELNVLMLSLLFGRLDSSTSIGRALFASFLCSAAHTAAQLCIELRLIDQSWIGTSYFDVTTEGGLVFWALSSSVMAMVYIFILCLPAICFRKYATLPSKPSFYFYCLLMSFFNILQTCGAILLFYKSSDGLCLVDISTFSYFCLLPPLIYFTFLRCSLKNPPSSSGGSLFMYRKQKDESGTGDLPEAYYPRFSGLTSPSYDDLFSFDRDARFTHYDITTGDYHTNPYAAPLIMTSVETAESTVTTRTGSEEGERMRDSVLFERHLKGLDANGTLVFEEHPRWYHH